MRGILIFNHLNDVLFTKCNEKFANHVQKLAKNQGLLSEEQCETRPSANIIMQLFSPIVTSQRAMVSQFGNCYTSVKCQDGTNMVFDEFMGCTFVYIALEDVELIMKRTLGVCISIVRFICGPDVSELKLDKHKVKLVSSMLDAWNHLRNHEQSFLIEAVEQLTVSGDLSTSINKVLQDAADKLKTQSELSNVHLLLLVENKFLSLHTSKNTQELSASDILLTALMCWVINGRNRTLEDQEEYEQQQDILLVSEPVKETLSQNVVNLFDEMESDDSTSVTGADVSLTDPVTSSLVLMSSQRGFSSGAMHIFPLEEGINLVIIVQMSSPTISSGLYEAFHHLNVCNNLQLQRDIDELRTAFDNLEGAIKKGLDGIKRNRGNVSNDVDMCQRRLQVKWEFVRKKYADVIKSRDPEAALQIESNATTFMDNMKELFKCACFDTNFLKLGNDVLATVARLIGQKLNDFADFLKVKALKNFSLGSDQFTRTCLTINKYLEEFPGLVHFIYIDRTSHRLTAPTLDFSNAETLALAAKKIWNMVEQSRIHLQEGHLSVMWKDTTFNYAYFLWFEDTSGTSLKCKGVANNFSKNLPIPGIFCGDYYRKLVEMCFPKLSPNKVKIYELFCVHLGLATSTCVLEHSRRLAATVWEVTGLPNNLN